MGLFPIVEFRVAKGDPQGFLDAARRQGMALRHFGRGEQGYQGEIPLRHYPALARLARENQALLRVKGRRGIWFHLRKYRKRLGFLAGITLFLGGLLFSQCFLWAIDVEPTERVTSQQVLDALEGQGVSIGAFLPGIDLEKAAMKARTELPGLSFLALNRIGSRIQVELADAVDPPEPKNPSGVCNVVAEKPGIIRSVEAYSGQQMVKPGQSVGEGTLLVSGVFENKDGKILYVHADAKVMAETEVSRAFSIPLSYTEKIPAGEPKTLYRVDFFGRKWPLFLAKKEKRLYESSFSLFEPKLGPVKIPIGVEKETRSFYEEVEMTRTEEEAMALLEHMAEVYGEELSKDAQVLNVEKSARVSDGKMELDVAYTLLEDIAESQPVDTPELTEN